MFNWSKHLHIIRGLPGEGKSTLALTFVGGDRRRVVENDDFWFVHTPTCPDKNRIEGPYTHYLTDNWASPDFSYKYDIELTHLAANWCGAETFRRLRIFDTVAVANTFVKRQHIIGYLDEARKLQVRVFLHRPQTKWVGNTSECFSKNIHNVPILAIQKMQEQWEDMTQDEVDILINLPSELRGSK
jgi:hypothetical protein